MTVRTRRVYECTCVRTVRQYQPEESCVREPQNHVKWAYVEDDDDDDDEDGDGDDDDDDRLEEVRVGYQETCCRGLAAVWRCSRGLGL